MTTKPDDKGPTDTSETDAAPEPSATSEKVGSAETAAEPTFKRQVEDAKRAAAPQDELRKAFDHFGRAAMALKEKYLSDEQIDETTARAKHGAEQLVSEFEQAARKAGGALDVVAVDAEHSLTKAAHEAELALKRAQRDAEPILRGTISKLTDFLKGAGAASSETASSDAPKEEESKTPKDGDA